MNCIFFPSCANAPKLSVFAAGILIWAIILTASVFGQKADSSVENTPPKRPRVGLVLSGGGARGFAHVGVIKVLEENHIPVDYISGASMGALVGALYATGRTPAEMENSIETLDWDELLHGKPTFDDLTLPAQGRPAQFARRDHSGRKKNESASAEQPQSGTRNRVWHLTV